MRVPGREVRIQHPARTPAPPLCRCARRSHSRIPEAPILAPKRRAGEDGEDTTSYGSRKRLAQPGPDFARDCVEPSDSASVFPWQSPKGSWLPLRGTVRRCREGLAQCVCVLRLADGLGGRLAPPLDADTPFLCVDLCPGRFSKLQRSSHVNSESAKSSKTHGGATRLFSGERSRSDLFADQEPVAEECQFPPPKAR